MSLEPKIFKTDTRENHNSNNNNGKGPKLSFNYLK